MYVYTPFVEQSMYPGVRHRPKDFNFESIFTENAFSAWTASRRQPADGGLTTRIIDPGYRRRDAASGGRATVRFRDQRITARWNAGLAAFLRRADRRLDDPGAAVDAGRIGAVRPRPARTRRLIVGALLADAVPDRQRRLPTDPRPDADRSVEPAERAGRDGLAVAAVRPDAAGVRRRPEQRRPWASSGSGLVLPGAASTRWAGQLQPGESRVTDGVIGFEYDAGCWIGASSFERRLDRAERGDDPGHGAARAGRAVAPGVEPAQVLKDNIPGYRMLRDNRSTPAPLLPSYD